MGLMVGYLPRKFVYNFAAFLGLIVYALSSRKREIVTENMRRIKPEASEWEVKLLACKSFINYAHYWMDFLSCYYLTFDEIYNRLVVPHGTEWFDRCLEEGKGVILALPHYGSWDLEGGWVGHQFPSFWAVAEILEPPPMYRFHTELRRRMGIRIIPLAENTAEKIIEVLLENGMVCLLSDRVIAGSSVEVDFFGGKADFPVGPALLAVKLGTPILPCHTISKGGKHHGYVGPPLEVEITGNTRRDVQVNTQKLARVFEQFIREDPTQWHMFQPIWKDAREAR
jgi:KDO2-lipid IV(A) lauroyltransferase